MKIQLFKKGGIFAVGIGLLSQMAYSQAIQAGFDIPSETCLNKSIQLTDQSINANRHEWDFCQGDLSLAPTASQVNLIGGNVPEDIDIVFDGVNWYGFVANREGNSIRRLSFGADIKSSPTVTDLGNIGSFFRNPTGIKIVSEGGLWYGFVHSYNGNLITRLDFGNSLINSPTAEVILTGGGGGDSDLDMVYSNGHWYVFYTSVGFVSLVRLNSITSIPQPEDHLVFPINGISFIAGCKLVRNGDNWFGYFVTNNGVNSLQQIAFGSTLFNPTPSITNLTGSFLSGYVPYGVEIGFDDEQYTLFISTLSGDLLSVDLGSDLFQPIVSTTPIGRLGVLTNTLKSKLIRHQSSWMLFSYNYATTDLYRVDFPNAPCSASNAFSDVKEPIVAYSTSGKKVITQRVYNGGKYDEITKSVVVENRPIVDFTTQNNCALHNVEFAPLNISGDLITGYDWDFGDSENSLLQTPTHQYTSSGTYIVTLSVITNDGCENMISKSLEIYEPPIADFDLPDPSVTCTNQVYTFTNTTLFNSGLAPTWHWSVDGLTLGITESFQRSFNTTASYSVKLVASIPGCSSETTKTYTVSEDGPTVDFTTVGICQNTPVTFTSNTTGEVSSLLWSFGDGATSPDGETTHSFSAIGDYNVELAVSNAAGCNNTITKPLTIYSQPQINFTTLAPPFSCSASATHFSNTTANPTDSNISGWAWNFGDAGSSQNTAGIKNPQHTYANAGEYSVSLTATTNFLCSATLEKTITIAQSPLADFTHAPLCEDSPVSFADAASTNKAWSWQIGSSFYTIENPEHTFANPGPYNVTLSVTGVNNCIGSATQAIVIPQKLAVDFTTTKACLLQDTEFTNITNDALDVITGISWDFGSAGTSVSDPAVVSFLTSGTVNVSLSTTTQSGCVYTITKPVLITDGPVAAFTATPNVGEAPLRITFTNTSVNATAYQWAFNDVNQQTSTQTSPVFMYSAEGFYTAELTARDAQGCSHTTQQLIEVKEQLQVRAPHPNPSNGNFDIEWKTEAGTLTTLTLVDGLGRAVQRDQVVSVAGINYFTLNLTNRPSGIYILTLNYLGTTQTFRLIVRQ